MVVPKKPHALFGYAHYDVDGKIITEIIEEQARVISSIFRYFIDERLTLNAIATKLNADPVSLTAMSSEKNEHRFHATTIEKILRRPEYGGYQRDTDDDLVPSTIFEGIISVEDWYHAQYLLNKKSSKNKGSKRQVDHPLTGIIKCAEYKKKYYIKPKANIYLHSQQEICKCNSQKSIPAKHSDELLFSIILDYLTRPELLKYRLRHHQMSWYFAHRVAKMTYTEPLTFPLSSKAISRAEKSLLAWDSTIEKSSIAFSRIESNLVFEARGMQSIHEAILPEISSYTKNAIQKWFTRIPKSARLELLDDSIESIELQGRRLIMSFFQDLKITVAIDYFKNRSSHWAKRRVENSKLGSTKWNIFEMPSFISQHVNKLIKRLCHDEESAGLMASNAICTNFLSRGLIPANRKFYFSISDYVYMQDTSIKKDNIWSFRYGNQGTVFIEADGSQETESPIHRNGELISFRLGNQAYFNAKFLHSLPEWFYGHNYEYFLADKQRICFIEDDNKILAKILGRGGKKIEIETARAFEIIMNSEKLRYIEID
ncbi:MAG: recombinase family protein [Spirochaetales bacterium]|nr:recombinase family protein [Spirochaetales bacterium]